MSSENASTAANHEANATIVTDIGHSPSIPPLFKPTNVRVKEYWGLISHVASYVSDTKEWKTSNVLKGYCTKCNISIPRSIQNPKQVQRHMVRFHEDYLSKKRKALSVEQKPVNHYFSKKYARSCFQR
jgi:hypothetical protein